MTPNGLIMNLFGPNESRKHDAAMLRESNLRGELKQFSHFENGNQLCIYGDHAYPLREHLQEPFRSGRNLTPEEAAYSIAMSHARVADQYPSCTTLTDVIFTTVKVQDETSIYGSKINSLGCIYFQKKIKNNIS